MEPFVAVSFASISHGFLFVNNFFQVFLIFFFFLTNSVFLTWKRFFVTAVTQTIFCVKYENPTLKNASRFWKSAISQGCMTSETARLVYHSFFLLSTTFFYFFRFFAIFFAKPLFFPYQSCFFASSGEANGPGIVEAPRCPPK